MSDDPLQLIAPNRADGEKKKRRKKKRTPVSDDERINLTPGEEVDILEKSEQETNIDKKAKKKISKRGQSGVMTERKTKRGQSGLRTERKTKRQKPQSIEETEENLDIHKEDLEALEIPKTMKKRKKRRERIPKDQIPGGEDNEGLQETEAEALNEPEPIELSGRICGVVLHRTDKLRENFLIRHPLVRVHIVNAETGEHLTKLDTTRAVTSYYETNKRDKVPEQILPVMSQPFDFKQMRSVVPWWEEMVVFSEEFNHLIQEKPAVIMFFELLDFISMNRASRLTNFNKKIPGESGWHKIAWAFLKLRGANFNLNTDKQIRLQLYEVPNSSRLLSDSHTVPVWQYWSRCPRHCYPSSLYVTVKSLLSQDHIEASNRSMFPNQPEVGTITLQELQRAARQSKSKDQVEDKQPEVWTRLPGQVCKVPNSLVLTLPAGKDGAFRLAFSHDGLYLAVACKDKSTHPILIYSIPSGSLHTVLEGHHNLVYELCWSQADNYLLSCSSDGSARLWDVEKSEVKKLLSHPSFVYCCAFAPRSSRVVVTGGYDAVIRIWSLDGPEIQAKLFQELSGHTTYINSLVFGLQQQKDKLYSGDNSGNIYVWNTYINEKKSTKNPIPQDWSFHSTIDTEVKGQSISKLVAHPSGSRIVIQTKDNTLRMLDLRMSAVNQRYTGALNFRETLNCDISPCGSLLFSGSEDACCYVWNVDTAEKVAEYTDLNYKHSVNVCYHPKEHMVAFSSRGDSQKVKVFKYEPSLDVTKQASFEAPGTSTSTSKLEAGGSTLGTNNMASTSRAEHKKHVDATMTSLLATSAMLSSQPSSRLASPRKDTLFSSGAGLETNPWGSMFSTSNLLESLGEKNKAGTAPKVWVAMYDYTPNQADELEMRTNDQISVLNQDESDWWTGINLRTGKQGLLPVNYVARST